MKYLGKNGEYFEVINITGENSDLLLNYDPSALCLLWFDSDDNYFNIDYKDYYFNNNDLICLTEFQKLRDLKINTIRMLKFNRPFYCILDHDSEVGCKGILFYGSSNFPQIEIKDRNLDVLETVWKMLCIEMESRDNLQLEMLQMMLKRILILCTRIYKEQANFEQLETGKVDIIREFNFLVETHFKEWHHVADYATALNKAPKTLSNLFKKLGDKTPSQFIQERLLLEARRQLVYTDKTVSEIGYEIGFSDVQSFSRFFKKNAGQSPVDFRKTTSSSSQRLNV